MKPCKNCGHDEIDHGLGDQGICDCSEFVPLSLPVALWKSLKRLYRQYKVEGELNDWYFGDR